MMIKFDKLQGFSQGINPLGIDPTCGKNHRTHSNIHSDDFAAAMRPLQKQMLFAKPPGSAGISPFHIPSCQIIRADLITEEHRRKEQEGKHNTPSRKHNTPSRTVITRTIAPEMQNATRSRKPNGVQRIKSELKQIPCIGSKRIRQEELVRFASRPDTHRPSILARSFMGFHDGSAVRGHGDPCPRIRGVARFLPDCLGKEIDRSHPAQSVDLLPDNGQHEPVKWTEHVFQGKRPLGDHSRPR